jgi:glycosyltransferase involved in cell wall biosynthesis
MDARHPPGNPVRVLWLTSLDGSPTGVRLDVGLACGLIQAGLELHLVAPEGSRYAAAARQASITGAGFPPRGLLGRAGARHLRNYCRDQEIGLAHLLDPLATAVAIPALGDSPLRLVARHTRTGGLQRWNPMARFTVLHSRLDRVVCTSQVGRTELARRRNPASVMAIRPGIDTGGYNVRPANLARLGVPAGAFSIAVVADYASRQGIEYIVDSLQWLPAESNPHLLLAGAGHHTRSVLERISRSPWRGNFHLLGSRDDAWRIAAACDVAVRAAFQDEGVSPAMLLSMACGVTPLIVNAGAAHELVASEDSGVIVRRRSARAIGEALAWLYAHPAERLAMGEAARVRVTRAFRLDNAVDAHLGLYQELSGLQRTKPGEGL